MMQLKRTVASVVGGLWGDEPSGSGFDVTVVRVADFNYRQLTLKASGTRRSIQTSLIRTRALRFGDLLLEKSGGGERTNVGRVVRWERDEQAITSNFVSVLRPARGFNSRYLAYLHRALYVEGYASACTKQNTGIQNLDVGAYLATEVPHLPFPQQAAVAAFLDRECRVIEELVEVVRSYGQLSANQAVARFAELTDGAARGRISYRFDVQLGKMLDEKRFEAGNASRYLRNANVQWDRIELGDLKTMSFSESDRKRFSLEPGDLLVCEGGQPGRCAVWGGQAADIYFQKALMRVRPRNSDSPRFLMWALRLASERGDFAADGTGSTILHLPAERLAATRVPMLDWDAQSAITTEVDAIARRGERMREEVEGLVQRLDEYRDALITEAVTGRLDVTKLSESRMAESLAAVREGERPEVLSS
ncbi:hypothetical protein AB0L40_22645 [Patulibacter sp. NPDC049589]|uniref:restriction endonuclease subunit S n=1 Tax=Patulibacter sp. NPDC049589 TaxID=3154731 RepID=UPI003437C932